MSKQKLYFINSETLELVDVETVNVATCYKMFHSKEDAIAFAGGDESKVFYDWYFSKWVTRDTENDIELSDNLEFTENT